ncbi:MAG: DNA gyrase subunit B, partial [Gammaproteobacteria bacterium]|nr:DNA gyrase subunit B [Gammaproteobacteria bacterium]
LTFFYRQMHELIERGYIYIAQPPLYKVKKGKQEQYVKDDAALNAHLLNSALEDARLHVNADAPAITGTALEQLAERYMAVMAAIRRLSRRYDPVILEKLVYMPTLEARIQQDAAQVADWFNELEQRANAALPPGQKFEILVALQTEPEGFVANVVKRTHGIIAAEQRLSSDFFASGEYQRMAEFGRQLDGLLGAGAYVMRGERKQDIASFKQAIEWLLEQARRGQHIQRYKGLGEMNPEQLWETTMNAETRRLLRVQIEDAVAADEIFTTLMGDQVEPRREFIETNALAVANLDV